MPQTWRLLATSPLSGAENMAVDELLLDRAATTGESVFRVYSWSTPTLSFGRHQRTQGAYDPATIAARGIGVVRRLTGGRALMHHREVTYSVTAPLSDQSLTATYDDINLLIVEGLRRLGVSAVVESRDKPSVPVGPSPCFRSPSAGELSVGGRKLVGSAQWRSEQALLQHGSILVHDDQGVVAELSSEPLAAVPSAATLADAMGREPSVSDVASALFGAVLASHPDATELPGDELLCWLSERQQRQHGLLSGRQPTEALAHVANRYRDESWTWRR